MVTSTVVFPTLLAASVPMFHCCTCTAYNQAQELVSDPLYATVWVCRLCGHHSCEKRHEGDLCLGCYYEEGRH